MDDTCVTIAIHLCRNDDGGNDVGIKVKGDIGRLEAIGLLQMVLADFASGYDVD